MQGRIVKGIAGFYYVDTEDGIFECRAKGIFRNQKVKPLVGDLVELEVLSQEEKEGSVISILPRKSELIRPAVANVDQALVIFALSRKRFRRLSVLIKAIWCQKKKGSIFGRSTGIVEVSFCLSVQKKEKEQTRSEIV